MTGKFAGKAAVATDGSTGISLAKANRVVEPETGFPLRQCLGKLNNLRLSV